MPCWDGWAWIESVWPIVMFGDQRGSIIELVAVAGLVVLSTAFVVVDTGYNYVVKMVLTGN